MGGNLPPGAVIVPAYLGDAAAAEALRDMLAALPQSAPLCIVVAQAGPTAMASIDGLRRLAGVEVVALPRGVGKWPAFAEGLEALCGNEEWVAAVDADGAFPWASVVDLAGHLLKSDADHAIGTRAPGAINLRAADEAGPRQRIHVEAFFNTLTLLRLGCLDDSRYRGADLQCGLHIFRPARLRRLRAQDLPFYGGELWLFHQTILAGGRVSFAPIAMEENPVSSYLLSEIVAELFALPFLAAATAEERARAFAETPGAYACWSLEVNSFEQDVAPFLNSGPSP